MNNLDALQKLPSLKGAPLSIIIALLIAGRPLQAQELEAFTGYANQAVSKGLKRLEILQAVVNMRRRGFMLTPAWKQLMLPLQALDDRLPNHENHDLNHENHDVDHENHDLPLVVSSRSITKTKVITNQPTNYKPQNHENHDLTGDGPENTAPTGKNVSPENTVVPGQISSTAAPENTVRTPEDDVITHWLGRGGIAPGSPKMLSLARRAPSAEYVQAHVLELLHQQREWRRSRNGRYPGTGALIFRLENGWPAPEMRCSECLQVEQDCRCNGNSYRQEIPPELEGIIKR